MASVLLNEGNVNESELLDIIIRPESLESVLRVLENQGLEPLSVMNVEGVGRQRGHTEIFRGREYNIETRPKTRIAVIVESSLRREEVIGCLREVVYTGHVGDGKIFVIPLCAWSEWHTPEEKVPG
jgi:nitrogen regulatory protein PII